VNILASITIKLDETDKEKLTALAKSQDLSIS